MRIASMHPSPQPQSIEPVLVLDLVLAFQRGQRIPLDLVVHVWTEDKKLLGIARPSNLGHDRLTLDAYESGYNEILVPVQAVLGLSPKQVDYLEGVRSRHRKGDVILECRVEAHFLASKVVNATLKPGKQLQDESGDEGTQAVVYTVHSPRNPFFSRNTNMWVLSGDGGRTFLERETLQHTSTITISSGDWLHDYAAPWGNTRYIVVELPQPEILTSTPNIEQHVNAAIDAAKNAAASLAKGEWNDVVEDLRRVWELVRNHASIRELLQRDGYTPDAIAALEAGIQQQFTFASKFMHRIDTSGRRINPELSASKEDALVCYSFAMSVLNLISRKAMRLR